AEPSSLSVCKTNTTGKCAARYASISALTFFSKVRLLRRSHLGPTLKESCASITSNADCATGTLSGSSMVSDNDVAECASRSSPRQKFSLVQLSESLTY